MSTFWILLEQMELFVIYIKICLKNGTSIAYLYEYY